MAIVLKNSKLNITIDSKITVGVMGNNYDEFLSSLEGDNIFYLDKRISISNKKVYSLIDVDNSEVIDTINDFKLKKDFLNKKISELSHSELKLLKYILLVSSDKKIIIIDEPFIDLDYNNKKKIILLINKLIKEKKTIIIGSVDSNVIYSLCKRVLFLNDDEYYYGDINTFKNNKILEKYHITTPDLVNFVMLAKSKGIKLSDSRDIRDLIKDVYRNVSKK